MSAIITPLPVSFQKPIPVSEDFNGIGAATGPFDLRNWFTATKSFTIDFALGGYAASLTWDFTDEDGGGEPGENPSGLQLQCGFNQVAFTPYWCRRLCQSGYNTLNLNFDNGSDVTGQITIFSATGFPTIHNTNDGLYYISTERLVIGGGTGDDTWAILGVGSGEDEVATFEWCGGSTNLVGSGSGADGTITMKTAETWS